MGRERRRWKEKEDRNAMKYRGMKNVVSTYHRENLLGVFKVPVTCEAAGEPVSGIQVLGLHHKDLRGGLKKTGGSSVVKEAVYL